MSRLIDQGDLILNYGKYLPTPYIQKITLLSTDRPPEDIVSYALDEEVPWYLSSTMSEGLTSAPIYFWATVDPDDALTVKRMLVEVEFSLNFISDETFVPALDLSDIFSDLSCYVVVASDRIRSLLELVVALTSTSSTMSGSRWMSLIVDGTIPNEHLSAVLGSKEELINLFDTHALFQKYVSKGEFIGSYSDAPNWWVSNFGVAGLWIYMALYEMEIDAAFEGITASSGLEEAKRFLVDFWASYSSYYVTRGYSAGSDIEMWHDAMAAEFPELFEAYPTGLEKASDLTDILLKFIYQLLGIGQVTIIHEIVLDPEDLKDKSVIAYDAEGNKIISASGYKANIPLLDYNAAGISPQEMVVLAFVGPSRLALGQPVGAPPTWSPAWSDYSGGWLMPEGETEIWARKPELSHFDDKLLFAKNFSDISYEYIYKDGKTSPPYEDLFFKKDGSIYIGTPIQALSAKYYATETLTHQDIIDTFQTIIGRWLGVARGSGPLQGTLDDVATVLGTHAEDPGILVELNKLRKTIPDKSGITPLGKFYNVFSDSVANTNAVIVSQPILVRQLTRSSKVSDQRDYMFRSLYGSYDTQMMSGYNYFTAGSWAWSYISSPFPMAYVYGTSIPVDSYTLDGVGIPCLYHYHGVPGTTISPEIFGTVMLQYEDWRESMFDFQNFADALGFGQDEWIASAPGEEAEGGAPEMPLGSTVQTEDLSIRANSFWVFDWEHALKHQSMLSRFLDLNAFEAIFGRELLNSKFTIWNTFLNRRATYGNPFDTGIPPSALWIDRSSYHYGGNPVEQVIDTRYFTWPGDGEVDQIVDERNAPNMHGTGWVASSDHTSMRAENSTWPGLSRITSFGTVPSVYTEENDFELDPAYYASESTAHHRPKMTEDDGGTLFQKAIFPRRISAFHENHPRGMFEWDPGFLPSYYPPTTALAEVHDFEYGENNMPKVYFPAYLIPRSFETITAGAFSELQSLVGLPGDYRLMIFEQQDILQFDDVFQVGTSYDFGELEDFRNMYKDWNVKINMLDATPSLATAAAEIFWEYAEFLTEYVRLANQFCAYNNIDGYFNEFFADAMRAEFTDEAQSPWVLAPLWYSIWESLLFGDPLVLEHGFDSILDPIFISAREWIDLINPSTGNLEDLNRFYGLYAKMLITQMSNSNGEILRLSWGTAPPAVVGTFGSWAAYYASELADIGFLKQLEFACFEGTRAGLGSLATTVASGYRVTEATYLGFMQYETDLVSSAATLLGDQAWGMPYILELEEEPGSIEEEYPECPSGMVWSTVEGGCMEDCSGKSRYSGKNGAVTRSEEFGYQEPGWYFVADDDWNPAIDGYVGMPGAGPAEGAIVRGKCYARCMANICARISSYRFDFDPDKEKCLPAWIGGSADLPCGSSSRYEAASCDDTLVTTMTACKDIWLALDKQNIYNWSTSTASWYLMT